MTTAQTEGQTLPYLTITTTISPLSCQSTSIIVAATSVLAHVGQLACWSLDALFEGRGVCSAVFADLLTLEQAIYHRFTLRTTTSWRSHSWPTSKSVLASCPTWLSPALSRPTPPVSLLQLSDLARAWSDRADNDIGLSDILAFAAAGDMFTKTDPRGTHQPRFLRALPDGRAPHQTPASQRYSVALSKDSLASFPAPSSTYWKP